MTGSMMVAEARSLHIIAEEKQHPVNNKTINDRIIQFITRLYSQSI